jgi:outer membrane receptor for ferrienterochelin and colicins
MSATSITPHAARIFLRHTLGLSPLLLGFPGLAHAQSVNYSDLEDMFGEPVTTSVTGKPQRASEAPAALVIITRDDIRRSPASDIPGLIQAYAGIDVVRWTGGQADISIRGGVQPYNPRLLVLVNGRQAYLDHYGMTNWAGLGVQLDEIQQIEVVKGPNSALFGFNAVSGVINIITINPLQTQQLVATAEVGTEGYRRVSQSAAIKLNEGLGLRLSGGYGKSGELDGLETSLLAPVFGSVIFSPTHKEAAGELYAKLGGLTEASLSTNSSESKQLEWTSTLATVPSHYRFASVAARISHDTGLNSEYRSLRFRSSHLFVTKSSWHLPRSWFARAHRTHFGWASNIAPTG